MSRPPLVAAAVLVAATVTLTAAVRRRPRPVAPARCTHLPLTTYAVIDLGGQAPVLQWCCEEWWLTHGQAHARDCQTVRGC
ncbi:hypothetical protein AB0K71_05965 [Streptomyces syringium]|uniref:hypothetical protein n=1 Tax=Streptomyces syringium TaxID=76729 RepID=UPI0034302822